MSLKTKVKKFIQPVRSGLRRDERSTRDKVYISSRKFESNESAMREFMICKDRLFQISGWNSINDFGAMFHLYERSGRPLSSAYVSCGDFIRIDFPDLFPVYWLKVQNVADDENVAQLVVEPSADPTGRENRVADLHLLPEKLYFLFRVERDGDKIFAVDITLIKGDADYGLNPTSEIDNEEWNAFQDRQWKKLTDFIVGS